jgi:hypothetical protein
VNAAADIELATFHGVSVETVAVLRATVLTEGLHYSVAGGGVNYTPEGCSAVAAALSADPPLQKKEGGRTRSKLPPAENTPPSLPHAALCVLRLYPNPLFVLVRTPDGGTADLHVRPHASLAPGSLIECELADGQWVCTHPGLIPRPRP